MRAMNSIWVEEGSGWQDVTTSSVRYVDDMDIPKKEEDLSTMINTKPNPEFELGEIVATPGAIEAMNATGTNPTHLLDRHVSGDWGDICAEDAKMNNEDLASGEGRLMSGINPIPQSYCHQNTKDRYGYRPNQKNEAEITPVPAELPMRPPVCFAQWRPCLHAVLKVLDQRNDTTPAEDNQPHARTTGGPHRGKHTQED
jgi:hypothetical protein